MVLLLPAAIVTAAESNARGRVESLAQGYSACRGGGKALIFEFRISNFD